MEEFKDEYKKRVKNNKINLDLNNKLKYAINNQPKEHKRYRFKLSYAVSIAALIVVSSASALAITKTDILKPSEWGGYEGHVYKQVNEKGVSKTTEEVKINNIDETKEMGNLNVKIKDVTTDNNILYLNIDVSTKDGSSLYSDNENNKSILGRQEFKDSYIKIDEEIFKIIFIRIDNGSEKDKAYFEGIVSLINENSNGETVKVDIKDKNIKLYLEDYLGEREVTKDIESNYESVSQMLEGVKILEKDDFVKNGIYIDYGDGSVADNYTIPKGNEKIYFSDKYPDAYIDNAGIRISGEITSESESLFLSIVPGSEKNAEELKNLCFENKNTGELIGLEDADFGEYIDTTINEGRLVLKFKLSQDDTSYDKNTNLDKITMNFLKNYRMKISKGIESVTLAEGKIFTDIKIKNILEEKVFAVNKTIDTSERTVTIHDVTLSPLYMTYSGKVVVKSGLEKRMVIPYLILNDGTRVDIGVKVGGSGDPSTGEIKMHCILNNIVDIEKVVGIEIDGQEIMFN